MAILSKVGLDDVVLGFADGADADADARLITATCGGVSFSSVYVPNGRAVGHDHYHYKLAWFARLGAHLAAAGGPDGAGGRSAATSTSPPRTATSGTRRPSRGRRT